MHANLWQVLTPNQTLLGLFFDRETAKKSVSLSWHKKGEVKFEDFALSTACMTPDGTIVRVEHATVYDTVVHL